MNELSVSATQSRASSRRSRRSVPAVRPPVLGQLDGGAGQLAVLLELALEQLEQRECVSRAARKTRDHPAVGERTHLAGVALHDGVAHADLSVTGNRDLAIATYRHDGRTSELFHCDQPFLRARG
jgi:hypothetical protein